MTSKHIITVQKGVSGQHQITELIFGIRARVFVEEQQVSRDEEFDDFENSSLHYLAVCNGIPAGTARWRFTSSQVMQA